MRSGCTYLILALLPLCICCTVMGQEVVFSHDGGRYVDTFSLGMHVEYFPGPTQPLTIHYTLNGNEPTECDAQYTAPLPLTAECYSMSDIYRVQTVPDSRWYEPNGVEHIVVVRAAAFDVDGYRRTPVNTQAYVIDSLLGRRIQLPVVSLCTDSLCLFDYDTGIFVRGWNYNPALPYNTGNYFQKGRDWERRASFAFYDTTGDVLVQDCGLRTHGNSQRVLAQKGISLYARRDYGSNSFRYPFFANSSFNIHHSTLDSYRRLVLRPWKTSWSEAGVEDWLCQQLAEPLRCDNLASRPVVLFLNGEYWGIYFIEEKADEHYVEEHYGVENREVDFLAYWGDEVENGSDARWNAFYEWLEKADMKDDRNYEYLASQVDIDALMDYMLMQILVLNDDWPVNNVRFWAAEDHPWRWVFFDGDGALASFPRSAAILDYMTYRVPKQITHTSPRSTLLFRRLYDNEKFRRRSLERLSEIVATHFAYETTAPILQSIVDEVSSEVPYQIARFGTPSSMAKWKVSVSLIDDFLRKEPVAMLNEYAIYFGFSTGISDTMSIVDGKALHFVSSTVGKHVLTVFDVNGRVVHQTEVQATAGPNDVALPLLPHGTYFVHLSAAGMSLRWNR